MYIYTHTYTNIHMYMCVIPYGCEGMIPYAWEGNGMRACRTPNAHSFRTDDV